MQSFLMLTTKTDQTGQMQRQICLCYVLMSEGMFSHVGLILFTHNVCFIEK